MTTSAVGDQAALRITPKRLERAFRTLRKRLDVIEQLAAKLSSSQRASPGDVHRLRRASRSVGAALALLPKSDRRAWRGLRKSVRRIRRAAGEVRNIDVAIKLLKTLPVASAHAAAARVVRSDLRRLRRSRLATLQHLLTGNPRPEDLDTSALAWTATPTTARRSISTLRAQLARLINPPHTDAHRLHQARIAMRKLVGILKVLEIQTPQRDRLAALAARLGRAQDLAVLVELVEHTLAEKARSASTERTALLAALRRIAAADRRAASRAIRQVTNATTHSPQRAGSAERSLPGARRLLVTRTSQTSTPQTRTDPSPALTRRH